jgi:Ca-activated chloride channel homolog
MTRSRTPKNLAIALVAVLVVVSACSGGTAPASTPASASAPAATPAASAPPSPSASSSPSAVATGPASVVAPATVEGGTEFTVDWTGPAGQGDYITVVAKGVAKWTNEPYFNTSTPSPGRLAAPTTAGDYEIWYVTGATATIAARRAITVTPFQGALAGPDSVAAGSPFMVTWTGPNGPNDYVTIVAVGTAKWTNEPYFYTHTANPGQLVAPTTAGAFELWYVTGSDGKAMAKRPITVTPLVITLKAPASVAKGTQFEVEWTGPNGPSDYITIVPIGSKAGTYASYAYTANGSPATIKAPDTAGKYEIWYASDRAAQTLAKIPIEVK